MNQSKYLGVRNLVIVCIDQMEDYLIKGRFYHCYTEHAVEYKSMIELLKRMNLFFNEIKCPQSANAIRSFTGRPVTRRIMEIPDKKVPQQEIMKKRGNIATYAIQVAFRQNSTWQGNLMHMESEESAVFNSEIELIKFISR